jgi:hypothetical protein
VASAPWWHWMQPALPSNSARPRRADSDSADASPERDGGRRAPGADRTPACARRRRWRLPGVVELRPLVAEGLAEQRDVLGDEAQAHLHHRGLAVALHRRLHRRARLDLQAVERAVPHQAGVVRGVEHRRVVAPEAMAGIAARQRVVVRPAELRHVAGGAGGRAVAGQARVEEQHAAEAQLVLAHRVAGRHRHRPAGRPAADAAEGGARVAQAPASSAAAASRSKSRSSASSPRLPMLPTLP